MKALILAAGYGTRLRPYTDHTPKPLFTIAGRPLLSIIIGNLQQAGCTGVMINTHHLHHKIEAFVTEQNYGLPVYTRYEPRILGTGGAIKNLADFWDDKPFMVINGDIVAEIDLKKVYDLHCRHRRAATLVLCDDSEFNSVSVDPDGFIIGFNPPSNRAGRPSSRVLTFTGIQVLEREFLEYIPAGVPYSSIDAFKKLMAAGKKLKAHVVKKGLWQDIGTGKRYRQTAFEKAQREAFRRAFPNHSCRRIQQIKLAGDGSERRWYRLKSNQNRLIMVDHGIRQTNATSEVDSFVYIGRHLHRRGVPVPRIILDDAFCGLVFLEDLGDVCLQQTIRATDNRGTIERLYQSVIEHLIHLSQDGASDFDPSWAYQTPEYTQTLILEKECRYFVEAFLRGYLGLNIRIADLQGEFVILAQKALQHATHGFMHRDMQSRNIMVKDESIYFIDFQGGRLGPIQYDLASLLIDPYVELPESVQTRLLKYSIDRLSSKTRVAPAKFRSCYAYCALTRNLQILGAFGYLSTVKGKTQFEEYIPAAVRTLRSNLTGADANEFPNLTGVVEEIASHIRQL